MKKRWLLKTVLAAGTLAAIIPAATVSAYAAESVPCYPDDFTKELVFDDGISDYAVSGDEYAFAVKTTVYVISTDSAGDRKLSLFTYDTQIQKLDYYQGKLYFMNMSGNAYAYSDVTTPVVHEFPEYANMIEGKDCWYALSDDDGVLSLIKNGKVSTVNKEGESFSKLKKYDDKIYAVKDNRPCLIEGDTATPLNLSYTDFTSADAISVGTIPNQLKSGNYTVTTANLKQSSMYTKVDDSKIEGTFKQVQTMRAEGAISCLVLAREGNLSLFVTKGGMFITASENLEISSYTPPANDWTAGADGKRLAYLRATGVYSSPYMCDSTLITRVSGSAAITVNVQEKFSLDFIDNSFYRITFKGQNGEEVSGFVAGGFLDKYDYAAENIDKTTVQDATSYENNVGTVLLILALVGLVILAIAYLTVVGTKSDKQKQDKKRKKPDPRD